MDAATKPITIQNVTFPNRQANEVVKALDKLWARYRAMRIPAKRFDSEGAKELPA